MDVSKRNLIVGLAGMVILLMSMLVYAQINAKRNFDLGEFEQVE